MEELSTREKMQVLDYATRHPASDIELTEERFKKMAALVAGPEEVVADEMDYRVKINSLQAKLLDLKAQILELELDRVIDG